jgi:RNase P subunit RPR2
MSLEAAPTSAHSLSRWLPRPHCPRCQDTLVAPERAEFLGEGRIRHNWICESCTHEFRMLIEVSAD